jgi:hypothetical protein
MAVWAVEVPSVHKTKIYGFFQTYSDFFWQKALFGIPVMWAEINFTNNFSRMGVQLCAAAILQFFCGCYTILTGKLVDIV